MAFVDFYFPILSYGNMIDDMNNDNNSFHSFFRDNVVNIQSGASKFEITTVATFEDHYCTVWRVSWNVLGTVLASSGDDGCVRLWKCKYQICYFFIKKNNKVGLCEKRSFCLFLVLIEVYSLYVCRTLESEKKRKYGVD